MFRKLRIRLKDTLLTNIIWSFVAKLFAMVFYFLADIFYARFLGVNNYAEWVFFFSIANMAFCVGWFGINISSKVHIAKSDEREKCFGASVVVRGFISGVILIIILLLASLIAEKTGYPQPYKNLKWLMLIMGWMVFFNSFTEFFKQFYIGIQEYKKLCVVTFIEHFSYCFFSIVFLLLYQNPISIALGYCVAGVVLIVCNFSILFRKYNKNLVSEGIRNCNLQGKILKYAMPLVLTSLGGLVLMEMDTFMLGLFCSKEQVSVYSIAKQLVSKATNVNMAIWTGTVASLAMITKENFVEKRNKFQKVKRLNNTVSATICICFAFFGGIVIKYLYGNQYYQASRILLLLIPYYFLYGISSLYANFLDFMGHARIRALWFISVIVINFSLNYLLIPLCGATGAAIATITSIIPYTIYCIYDVWKIFKNKAACYGCSEKGD